MGVLETIGQLEQGVLNEIAQLQEQLQVVQGMKTQYEADLKSAEEKGFEEGLKQAGQAGGSDKLYSDAELNAEIQPREEKIAELTAKVSELEAQVQSIPTQVSDAVASFKAELKAQYEAQQVAETQAETGFGDLLK